MQKLNLMVKKDKNRNIILLLGICGIVLIALSSILSSKNKKAVESKPAVSQATEVREYEKNLEAKLSQIVSAITGEEKIEVMVTLESDTRQIYAADEKKNKQGTQLYGDSGLKETENTDERESSYIILKGADGIQQALKVTEIQPVIKGVVVVSKQADDSIVKEKVISAVKTALGIASSKVCVVSAK